MNPKITLVHPDLNKHGVTIDKTKYDVIREAILNLLEKRGRLTYTELVQEIETQLAGQFIGSIPWYVEGVKLDLEGKHVIERVKDKGRDFLQLIRE